MLRKPGNVAWRKGMITERGKHIPHIEIVGAMLGELCLARQRPTNSEERAVR